MEGSQRLPRIRVCIRTEEFSVGPQGSFAQAARPWRHSDGGFLTSHPTREKKPFGGSRDVCGILGAVGTEPVGLGKGVERGLDALSHRGPDARGVKTLTGSRSACVLGHTRLRIVDLSSDCLLYT